MTAGRPRKFESPEDIDSKAASYFKEMDQLERPYTVSGLAEALGTFRIVLSDYEKGTYDTETEKYSYAIKRAKQKIERYAEEAVYTKTAGAVFTLVNLTRNSAEPWKNAQHNEIAGDPKAPLTITLLKADENL